MIELELTVLGKYSPFAPARGACVGYWVSEGGSGVLLDAGPGTLARFQEKVGPLSMIRSVVLSHLHFDHMSDFMVLRYAAASDARYRSLPPRVAVYAPSEPSTEFSLLKYKDCVEAKPIEYHRDIEIGDLRLSFYPTIHAIPSYAVRVEASDGTVLAYSGDSRPCPGLLEAARDADLFLCEASAVEEDADFAAPGHLTSRQAGEIASQAGAKRLLLTHLWPLYDERDLLRECRDVFPGADVVQELRVYSVG